MVQKGLDVFSASILSRVMSQEQYGIIATFISWQSVIFIIATLNMSSGVFGNGMKDFKDDKHSFMFSILILANVTTLALAGIYVLAYRFLQPIVDMSATLMLVMLLYCLFMPAYAYWMGKLRYEYNHKSLPIVMMIVSLCATALAIIFVLQVNEGQKAAAKIIGSESPFILAGVVSAVYLLISSKARIKKAYIKYAFNFSLPLIPHYLSLYVLASSDRVMITKIIGSDATANYSMAYNIAALLLILWNAIDASYVPWIYQHMENGNTTEIRKRGSLLLSLFALVALICALFSPEIISILAPPSYYSGIYVVPSVTVGVFFMACYALFMRIELFAKKTKYSMISTAIAAALNITLNLLFIPRFGFIAAGYTTMICYALLALFHAMILRKIGFGHVYNLRYIALLSFLVAGGAALVTLVFNMTIVRYGMVVVLIALLLWKKNAILKVMRKEEN